MACRCTSSESLRNFRLTTTVYDITWDLFAFAGYSTASELGGGAIVVAFRGTDSHSLYNWVENMRYWKTDYDIPYPGAEGALVHTGDSFKLEIVDDVRHGKKEAHVYLLYCLLQSSLLVYVLRGSNGRHCQD